jgi:hypothetical protein
LGIWNVYWSSSSGFATLGDLVFVFVSLPLFR